MASIFKNAIRTVGTTTPVGDSASDNFTTIYTAPSGKTSYIIECDVASTGNTGVQISVRVRDNSANTTAFIVKNAPVPIGSAIQIIDGQKIVLEAGDSLQIKCDTMSATVDAIVSLIEDV